MTAGSIGGSILSASAAVITVTVGFDGVVDYGFRLSSYGSRSPTLVYGQTINAIYTTNATGTVVILAGLLGITFFNRVTFKYGASGATASSVVASSASFSNPGGNTSQWQWAGNFFSATDNGLARLVIFYR